MNNWKAVDQETAQQIDEHLMGSEVGYSVDQLMELAGLSVAIVVARCSDVSDKIAVVVGPGNNGGDGLVAARHLIQFGFSVDVYCPKEPNKELYQRLILQLKNHNVEIIRNLPKDKLTLDKYDSIVDALFGFGFKGDPREPYASFLKLLAENPYKTFAVDVPSGWHVDGGPHAQDYMPAFLISLTVPKLCALKFTGSHWLGGRFVPASTAQKFSLQLPKFTGYHLVMQLGSKAASAK
eukprot:Gregarina_sp_Pseudo_9__2391@NODE_2694_length_909_cov_10_587356_g2469_i0_p1_GENE_NODE_2694_length_909_cov_10_587356_g2469_i0NODE_2694_length_909_cov_10_587356_g2469_i0_p1_ORF_typecomplete_len237_score22_77YjeF_N/PF03853_15/7_3e45NAD_binding_7/PF13241_6/0_084_NODE_2694_length_909_cov_10_587356_g2469_i0128838